ncbi:hypothetical protein [Enterococcus asini]|uniref:hypothetical protein n=1 Tax=Enterococcus asini TaxID=57732 RepID=UPI00241FEB50|nr:hypothetical protein [Enterococcus asini]
MERINSVFGDIRHGAREFFKDLENWFNQNQRRGILTFVGILLFVAVFSVSMMTAQGNIRESEYEEIVFSDLATDRLKSIPYGTEDQFIKKQKAISVMFAPPHGSQRAKTDEILTKKGTELNRDFYYYPLVYDTVNIGERYDLDPTKVTFVFFEGGEEKNRVELADINDLNSSLIPELNRLTMWNIKTIEE